MGDKCVYELVDATSDEVYYPLGIFEDLAGLVRDLGKYNPNDLDEFDSSQDGYYRVEVRKRVIGWKNSEFAPVLIIEWTADYDDDEPVWKRVEGEGE